MKKFIALFAVLAFLLNTVGAQEATKAKTTAEPKKAVQKDKIKKEEKAEKINKEEKTAKTDEGRTTNQDAHLKQDGTPDKRYKENKEPKKEVVGPTKKDGTPDMRYKENKEKEAKKK